MKAIGITLLMLSGAALVGAIKVVRGTLDAGVGTYFGALVIPGLLLWWGLIALRVAQRRKSAALDGGAPQR
jgi:hypothetical protein